MVEGQPALDAMSPEVEWLIKRCNRREGMVILFDMITLLKRIRWIGELELDVKNV